MAAEALHDLLEACRARPGSAALLRALLAEADLADDPRPAADFLAEADPELVADLRVRAEAADFLRGQDELAAAERWSSTPPVQAQAGGGVVVDLATRRVQSAAPPQAPPALPPLRFDDVGGLDEVKAQVRRKIIAPLEKPGLFEKFRRKSGGGVLMYGPPGCGKTLLARATAGEAGATFTAVQITDILDMYIGESERRLAEAFAEARERRPSVLFFDELEALAARRHYGAQDHKASMVSTFLNEFDGANASNEGVLVLAATNVPWAIDSAFRRPGRFDRVLFVPPPDRPARLAILKGLLRDRPVAPGLKLESLAEGTTGYSGADLRNLVETAVDLAIEESSAGDLIQPVSRRHLDAARAEVRPTTAEWLSTARNYVRYGNEGGIYDDVARFLDQHAR